MKKDREYPATHSMATSWFGIDKDGKVALIEFEDNGPVPYGCGDQCACDLISDEMVSVRHDGIKDMNYTAEQAVELEKILKVPEMDMLNWDCIVKVNPDYKEEFENICVENWDKDYCRDPYVVVCEGNCLYKVLFNEWSDEIKEYLLKRGVITGVAEAEIDTDSSWDEENKKWVFESEGIHCYPYYFYQQPYSLDQLTEQTSVPRIPFMADQLDEKARSNALHFPISFSETPLLQIAEYFQIECHMTPERRYEGIRKIYSYLLPAQDGGKMRVRTEIIGYPECDRCGKCKLPNCDIYKTFGITQYGLHPTVLLLTAPLDLVKRDTCPEEYKELFSSRSNLMRIISIPVVPGIPAIRERYYYYGEELKKLIEQQDMKIWFSNCRDNFVESVGMIFPRVIIASVDADRIVREFFPIKDKEIAIGENTYPYYVLEQGTNHINEILHFSMLPYRGLLPERITYIGNKDE